MKGSLAQSLPRQQGLPLNSFPPKFSVKLFFGERSISPKIAFSFGTFLEPVPIFSIGSEAKEKYETWDRAVLIEGYYIAIITGNNC